MVAAAKGEVDMSKNTDITDPFDTDTENTMEEKMRKASTLLTDGAATDFDEADVISSTKKEEQEGRLPRPEHRTLVWSLSRRSSR